MSATNLFQNPKPSPKFKFNSPFPQSNLLNGQHSPRKFSSTDPRRSLTISRPHFPCFKLNLSFKSHAQSSDGELGGGLGVNVDDLLGKPEFELPVELSVTRTLPPALTLGHGVRRLREEIEKLKLNPPSSSSGVLRFQVAVPPSTKALDWLCCQQKRLSVFPQFYISGKHNALGSADGVCEVSGVGAAIYFYGSAIKGCNMMARFCFLLVLLIYV